MSIETAVFAVQRGDQQFSCKGSELKDKLSGGDILAVQRGAVASRFVVEMPFDFDQFGLPYFHILNGDEEWNIGHRYAYGIDQYTPEGVFIERSETIKANAEVVIVPTQRTEVPSEPLKDLFRFAEKQFEFGPLTNTSFATSFRNLFEGATFIPNGVSDFDVSNVTNFANCFRVVKTIDIPDLSKWDVSKAENMYSMFEQAKVFTGRGLENWDVSNVSNFNSMFRYNYELNNFGVESWNTKSATDMEAMFEIARAMENVDLSQWCVPLIDSVPDSFNRNIVLTPPKWGECPRGEDQS